jgi:hypothetical protein
MPASCSAPARVIRWPIVDLLLGRIALRMTMNKSLKTQLLSPRRSATALVGVLAVASATFANDLVTTLTFDELPFQSVDDLSTAGVAFDFKIDGLDSTEAYYNSFGPGTLTYVDDPTLTGDAAGVLTLNFAEPATVLQFGVALNTGQSLDPGVFVELLDEGAQTVDMIELATNAVGALGFSEAHFDYLGAPVTQAVIHFAAGPDSFAIDNLAFGIPEPASFLLGNIAVGLIGSVLRMNRPGAEDYGANSSNRRC